MRRYYRLWKYFLESGEAFEFIKERGISLKEIKNIGINKFIRANDWRCEEDVKKWRTDIIPVIICPHCRKDFGILDTTTIGLCDKCLNFFDLNRFNKDLNVLYGKDPETMSKVIYAFIKDKDVRDIYLKNKTKKGDQLIHDRSKHTRFNHKRVHPQTISRPKPGS